MDMKQDASIQWSFDIDPRSGAKLFRRIQHLECSVHTYNLWMFH